MYQVQVIVDNSVVNPVGGDVTQIIIPFGKEYKLRFRNDQGYSPMRAVAKVWIDGINVSGNGLIIPARGYADLETPISSPGKKFRFASVESYGAKQAGKDGPDDGTKGVIKVDFHAEDLPVPSPVSTVKTPAAGFAPDYGGSIPRSFSPRYMQSPKIGTGDFYNQSAETVGGQSIGQAGVTVEGSYSDQRFRTEVMSYNPVPSETIVLTLRGYTPQMPHQIHSPWYQSHDMKYCFHCGSSLSALSNLCPVCHQRIR